MRKHKSNVRFGLNDNDSMIPEFWANDILMQLYDMIIMPGLVHRDYQNKLQTFGDTVNVRRPNTLKAYRKSKRDPVLTQDVGAPNIQIKLDQHVYNSFLLDDIDDTLSMIELQELYSKPAAEGMAKLMDLCTYAMVYKFLDNTTGKLQTLSSSNAYSYMVGAREAMNDRNVPEENRKLVITNNFEALALQEELFVSANKVGDQGQALQNAILGKKAGWPTYAHTLAFNIRNTYATTPTDVDEATGKPAGSTSFTVTSGTGIAVGSWIVVRGVPYQVTAVSTNLLTIHRGLVEAIVDADPVTICNKALVNNASGYAIGYDKYIAFDTATAAPVQGQMVTFGTTTGVDARYAIVDVVGNTFMLDRALETAIADNSAMYFGAHGQYNFAFIKNAMALVNRPLKMVQAGTGALSAVRELYGMSMRATIAYDADYQTQRVTLDMLQGTKVLDVRMGQVVLG